MWNEENNILKEKIKKLENDIIELIYRPEGPGYYEAKDDFYLLSN